MAVLGVILLLAALIIAGFCLWAASMATTPAATVNMFDNTLSITPTTMFLLGAVAMLLLLLGIWFAFFATKRRYRSHKERRTLEKREKEQAAELEETRAKLGRQQAERQTREQREPVREQREPVREQVRRDEPVREQTVRREPVREERLTGEPRRDENFRDDNLRDDNLRGEGFRDERDAGLNREQAPGDTRGGAPHGDGDYLPPRDGR